MADEPKNFDGKPVEGGALRPRKVDLPENVDKVYQELVKQRALRSAYNMVAQQFDTMRENKQFPPKPYAPEAVRKNAEGIAGKITAEWSGSFDAMRERQGFKEMIEGNAQFLAEKGKEPDAGTKALAADNVAEAMGKMFAREKLYAENGRLQMVRSQMDFDITNPNRVGAFDADLRAQLDRGISLQQQAIDKAPLAILMPPQIDKDGDRVPPFPLNPPRVVIEGIGPILPDSNTPKSSVEVPDAPKKKSLFRPVTPEELARNPALRGAVGRLRSGLLEVTPSDGGDAPLFNPKTIPDFPAYEAGPTFVPVPRKAPANTQEKDKSQPPKTEEELQRERLREDLKNGAKIAKQPGQKTSANETPQNPMAALVAEAEKVTLATDVNKALPNLKGGLSNTIQVS